jgi:hypothetical protein
MAKITNIDHQKCIKCHWWSEYPLDPNLGVVSMDKRCNIPDDQECHSGSGFKERGL